MSLGDGLRLLRETVHRGVARRHEIVAGLALLCCVAVVFNIGPFCKIDKQRVALAAAALPPAALPPAVAPAGRELAATAQTFSSAPWVALPDVSFASLSASTHLDFLPRSTIERDGDGQAQETAPAPHMPPPLAAIGGIWAPDGAVCSAQDSREALPTLVTSEGAWAGGTFCSFRNQRPIEAGWKVTATCSNARERWTTEVRLSLKDHRLIWASRRGTQRYTRCTPDVLIAAR